MPKFPTKRADRIALVNATLAGIAANPLIFPSGPGQKYVTTTLTARLAAATTSGDNVIATEAARAIAVDTDGDNIELLVEEEERILSQAETDYGVSAPENLLLLGWGPRSEPTFNAPGQARNLDATVQGPATVDLDWKSPLRTEATGRPSYYLLTRQIRTLAGVVTEDWGVWQASSIPSEAVLTDLPRGVEIDFRVEAINNNGAGPASNTVTVVL